MNASPLVSAIIIFLNGETFIDEAIRSIIAQTYEHWELLLVDDGSTDLSTAIAQSYTHKYSEKVLYLEHDQHQNRGMSASRNLGITHSKGDFIAFLDSDDIWLPEKLEKQLALFQHHPEASVVCGPTKWWYSWMGDPQHNVVDSMRHITREYNRLFTPPLLLERLLLNQARTPATCSVLIKRKLFRVTGLFEEQFQTLYEDQAFFSKVYLKANVYISSQHWDLYRQHTNNCCWVAEKTGQGIPGHLNTAHLSFLKWLKQYMLTTDTSDTRILKVIDKSLWAYEHQGLYYIQHPIKLFRMIGRVILPYTWRHWLWHRYMLIKGIDL